MAYNNSTIKIIISALVFFIILPSCGEKAYHSPNGSQFQMPIVETPRHPTRRGQRIAVNTQSPITRYRNQRQTVRLNPTQQDQDEAPIFIEDVSIQEYRLIGNQLIATLKISINNEEAEIDLIGTILEDGTADLLPLGGNTLVHGVALCIDKKLCHQIVLDIYYRDAHGILQRHQVQSITPPDEDSQESPPTPREESPPPLTQEGQPPAERPTPEENLKQPRRPVVNVPPDIPEGDNNPSMNIPENRDNTPIGIPKSSDHIPVDIPEDSDEDPAGTFVTRPPRDLEAIGSLPIPTRPIILQQQQHTIAIRRRIQQGETIESIKENPPVLEATPRSEPVHTETQEVTPDPPESVPETPSERQGELSPEDRPLIPKVTVTEEYKIDPGVYNKTDPEVEVRQAMDIPSGQFLDNYVSQFGAYHNAVQEQAINRRSRGTLEQAELLVRDIHGVKWLARGDSHIKWVTSLTNHFLRIVGPQFQRQHPSHFIIVNRSSSQHGGYLRGHKTHQNGLDLDIAYPHADPTAQRFWSVYNGRGQFIMTEEDAQITMDLLKIMSGTNVVNKYHVDQSVKDYLTIVAQTKGKLREYCPILTQLCHARGHRNHIHVQLKCTEFNRGCQDSVDPPYSTCPAPQACQSL